MQKNTAISRGELEHEADRLAVLRNALIEGEKGGAVPAFDIATFIAQKSIRAARKPICIPPQDPREL